MYKTFGNHAVSKEWSIPYFKRKSTLILYNDFSCRKYGTFPFVYLLRIAMMSQ